jgi:hypothetical protein
MRITVENSNVVLVDVQQKLFPVISEGRALETKLETLLHGLHILNVTPIVTEQYPEKLGGTILSLSDFTKDSKVYEKRAFSCFGNQDFQTNILSSVKKKLILCGIETHVCVLQTGLDALALGLDVFIVEDAVGSRNPQDKNVALKRLLQCGAQMTTVESLLFELLETSTHEKFREISKLIK